MHATYDIYITSLSLDNLAGAEEVIGWALGHLPVKKVRGEEGGGKEISTIGA